ncbi:AAA family ATPase [Alysiella filiformis]|uniref:AAA domain-containing protein, putative AbiEii toxin, Type IV TA system n=1 Tax=Alysiella filiformis DSM 16848 TaxID=1120981 RepID=A0A286EBI8_9NEIS|nr:AAA family ATPase [Alysiella filiformis]QMT31274.1 AAA family ATPase [Alysiella filiformis]UBQ55723.1 ATP-binding protein [Alysiella filiformis DSM 16848]SOD68249.1 AAA domain-containing protein, putative AbiEii toxin, Type IV TA system [Alysiella filiformis DSM 16848]
MELKIKNIGVVKEANIQFNGLTVICGENDTGKSTIGKTLFALVKGIIGYEEEFQEELSYEIFTRFRQISRLIEHSINLEKLDDKQLEDIQKYTQINSFFLTRRIKSGKLQNNYFTSLIQLLKDLLSNNLITESVYERFEFYIRDIEDFLQQTNNSNLKQKLALERAFFSEFQSLITSSSNISFLQNNHQLDIAFNSKSKIKGNLSNLENFYFSEITYIETPSVIQFFKLIMSAGVKLTEQSRAKETVPLHTKDLTRKLFNSDNISNHEIFYNIHEMIHESIQGDFAYDNNQKDFFLNRNGVVIPSMDIASGIKSLGMIDILIKNNILNPNDILILDEPEVNLHPEWQKKYAEIICLLAQSSVKVLVVTHSPYMVSALHHYSKNISIHRNFYWAEKGMYGTYFSDETKNVMGGIVKKFALALEGMY